MRQKIKGLLRRLKLHPQSDLQHLENDLTLWKSGFVPPGHFYSPLNNKAFLEGNKDQLYNYNHDIKDIDLRTEEQKVFLQELLVHYKKVPFTKEPKNGLRYYFDNKFFSYSDGIFLFCLLQYLKPSKIIEVGSGFSSACMLDTNEHFFNNSIELTFIEPYPEERLFKLIQPSDHATNLKKFIQDVDLSLFSTLQPNDILFIDSSHVSKFGSDLNHILFNILPIIPVGVYIHFHDVFYPFEYPKEWLLAERAWNESYLLRAFLMNNNKYQITLFPSMLEYFHKSWLQEHMPLTMEVHEKWPSEEDFKYLLPTMGQSIWLKKL
jgi:hypothetical protein